MTLDVTINVWKEGFQYVAHAMPLDVMSSGPTPDAARQAVEEALQCFLGTAEQVGTLPEVWEACHFGRNGAWAVESAVAANRSR